MMLYETHNRLHTILPNVHTRAYTVVKQGNITMSFTWPILCMYVHMYMYMHLHSMWSTLFKGVVEASSFILVELSPSV